ncbi:hypothetical protein Poli38472_006474 [Pythium oligandrum]|uniref:Crinkler (CRN) family protein n=1 Tax=Pythium oligandrum TaxID=41045 RepID=A0A8K1C4U8_PYTOL|nr:hypothetical protein Poli38472_006474 [Pythium oligandrum]|eukprot:TMW56464.1 hypothetical protein Poli38472_006474 [Pythium oligandrum]
MWFTYTQVEQVKLGAVDHSEAPHETTYFDMAGFPPMIHEAPQNTRIMERKSYCVIFEGMLEHVTRCLTRKVSGNVIVTGNPGIGKSHFYLYCIFRLITRQQDMVKRLPEFQLLLNCKDEYHLYDDVRKDFTSLSLADVKEQGLSSSRSVVRLINGNSDHFKPWSGVNVLFSSPGEADVKDLEKDNPRLFIMPLWTFHEVKEYNTLLKDGCDGLALTDSELEEGFTVFGGIPRSIFSLDPESERRKLEEIIVSCDAGDVVEYVKSNYSVRQSHFSERLLQMVPTPPHIERDRRCHLPLNTLAISCSLRWKTDTCRWVASFLALLTP